MARSWDEVSGPALPEMLTPVTVVFTVSAVSTSLTVSVPDADSARLVSAKVTAAESVVTKCMSGASLVPAIVTVTLCVTVEPCPSDMETV